MESTIGEHTPQTEIVKTESETVRCIIRRGSEVLMLKKSKKSSLASEAYEFPGGNIDDIQGSTATEEEQIVAVKKEVLEETGIDLGDNIPKKVDEFDYEFRGKWEVLKRKVHLFIVDLDAGQEQTISVGGIESDFHEKAVWVSIEELKKMKADTESFGDHADVKLLGNSLHFEKALGLQQ